MSASLLRKLNMQIAHITDERATDNPDKIGLRDRRTLLDALITALRRFEGDIEPRHRARWFTPSLPPSLSQAAVATNAVEMMSTATSSHVVPTTTAPILTNANTVVVPQSRTWRRRAKALTRAERETIHYCQNRAWPGRVTG